MVATSIDFGEIEILKIFVAKKSQKIQNLTFRVKNQSKIGDLVDASHDPKKRVAQEVPRENRCCAKPTEAF